jgi:outer membrane immunogenic protein
LATVAFFAGAADAASPAATWTGFYIGGNLGGVSSRSSGTSDFLDPSAPPGLTSTPQSNSFNNTSFIGGVQAGYNWQFAPRWVAGVEADWDWTRVRYDFCRQTDIFSVACADNGFGFQSTSSRTDWLATLRGRLGFTVADFLLYATGGLALGHVETTITQSCLVGGCGNSVTIRLTQGDSSTDKVGWVAGLGAEYAFNSNWSARAEWLYVDLGNINSTLVASTPDVAPPTQTGVWSRREQYHQFRIGVNYHFH